MKICNVYTIDFLAFLLSRTFSPLQNSEDKHRFGWYQFPEESYATSPDITRRRTYTVFPPAPARMVMMYAFSNQHTFTMHTTSHFCFLVSCESTRTTRTCTCRSIWRRINKFNTFDAMKRCLASVSYYYCLSSSPLFRSTPPNGNRKHEDIFCMLRKTVGVSIRSIFRGSSLIDGRRRRPNQ